jgi:hypothetical protein
MTKDVREMKYFMMNSRDSTIDAITPILDDGIKESSHVVKIKNKKQKANECDIYRKHR